MIPHVHPDGEPTPTLLELHERKDGSVEVVDYNKDLKPTKFRLTEKGHRLLGEIMRRNALASRARGTTEEEGVEIVRRMAKTPETERKGSGRKGTWTEA